ncbi:hypothetical protein IV203_002117 [Nitzschia inconspicua]|uniref:Uncharacterized protein n=1 Tax=Nitzschia inconspicua TaxID=303405 RepID=A0A9K3P9Y9_9STRA|nr:hypothetical protein IV203_002441 [Nitzschia inconspicua]KAG7357429.1 hypothetical protein IV203_002117 [Nitzschia inconspicua]
MISSLQEVRPLVTLEESKECMVNKKMQVCYIFRMAGDDNIYHAVARYFRVEVKGNKEDFFDPPNREFENDSFQEPKINWKKSKAKELLFERIIDGIIPLDSNDTSMSLEEIYSIEVEFNRYSFEHFSRRLQALRRQITASNNRASDDLVAFENYKNNHEVSLFSHKGYAQWQGSTAPELLWDDLEAYRLNPNSMPKDLWLSRKEYRDEWPLHAFRSKIEQEIRTANDCPSFGNHSECGQYYCFVLQRIHQALRKSPDHHLIALCLRSVFTVQFDIRNNPATPLKSPPTNLPQANQLPTMTTIQPHYPKGSHHFDVVEGEELYPDGFHFSFDDELVAIDGKHVFRGFSFRKEVDPRWVIDFPEIEKMPFKAEIVEGVDNEIMVGFPAMDYNHWIVFQINSSVQKLNSRWTNVQTTSTTREKI